MSMAVNDRGESCCFGLQIQLQKIMNDVYGNAADLKHR